MNPAFLLFVAWLASDAAAPVVVRGAEDVELIEAVRAVAGKTATWRGARFSTPPLALRATPVQRAAVARETLDSWISPERLAARGRAWSDLGLGSAESPAEVYGALAGDIDGLALTSDGRRMLLDPERLSERDFGPVEGPDPALSLLLATGVRPDEPAVAHLADHALDLQGAPGAARETTDALLAWRAWSEGRANLLACQLLFDGIGAADVVHAPSFNPASVLQGALVPEAYFSGSAVARSLLYFVYGEGFAQAAALAKDGGAAAIARAATARPTSRDVLHPERPAAGSARTEPSAIALPAGFVLVDRDELGEQGIVTLVSVATGKDNLGLLAGDGWRSDGLFRYEPEKGSADPKAGGFTVWISRWVSEAEAEDFAYGVGRVLEARFPGVPIESVGQGRRVLRAGDRIFRLDRSRDSVSVRVADRREDEFLESSSGTRPEKAPPSRSK